MKDFNVEQWVSLFRMIGLDDATMQQWHHLFEENYPDAHQDFLEWLGVPQEKINAIRQS